MMEQRGPPGAPRANGDVEGGPGQAWPSHQGAMASSGGIHFMQHPPHLQPVYYQVAPRPAVYPGMVGFMPGPVPAHAGGLFPLVGPGRLPPAGQTPERERPSGWGGAPLGQREGSAERQYSGQIELPGSLGSSPVASTYLNNGAFRGPFDEASSAPPASHGGAAGGHSRHRSRDEDSATPCPFYMKTATCAYGDMCAPLARFARWHASIEYSFARRALMPTSWAHRGAVTCLRRSPLCSSARSDAPRCAAANSFIRQPSRQCSSTPSGCPCDPVRAPRRCRLVLRPSPACCGAVCGDGRALMRRAGEPNCRFYMQTMRCDYGPSCKYNHPEPCHAAGPAWRPPAMSWGPHMQLPVPGNGAPARSAW